MLSKELTDVFEREVLPRLVGPGENALHMFHHILSSQFLTHCPT